MVRPVAGALRDVQYSGGLAHLSWSLLVGSVVRLDDVARQAAAVADRPSAALGPVTDGLQRFSTPTSGVRHGTARALRAASAARAGPSAATGTPSGCNEWGKDLSQRLGVVLGEV